MSTARANELPQIAANYESLSPLSFLKRAARTYPERTAVVHGLEPTNALSVERVRSA